jgi:hypothetical protein
MDGGASTTHLDMDAVPPSDLVLCEANLHCIACGNRGYDRA